MTLERHRVVGGAEARAAGIHALCVVSRPSAANRGSSPFESTPVYRRTTTPHPCFVVFRAVNGPDVAIADDEAPRRLTCFVIGPIGSKHATIGSPERQTYEDALLVFDEIIKPAC